MSSSGKSKMIDFDRKKLDLITAKVAQMPTGDDGPIDLGDTWRRACKSAAKVRGFVSAINNRLWVVFMLFSLSMGQLPRSLRRTTTI
jgi:hypothetical protein